MDLSTERFIPAQIDKARHAGPYAGHPSAIDLHRAMIRSLLTRTGPAMWELLYFGNRTVPEATT